MATTLWAYVVAYLGGGLVGRYIFKSTDSGATWAIEDSLQNTYSTVYPNHGDRRLHGLSPSNQYVAAQTLGLWHRTEDGEDFNLELYPGSGIVPSGIRFFTVFAISADNVWTGAGPVTGGAGLLFHWDGEDWTDRSSELTGAVEDPYQVLSIWANSSTDIWFVGTDNTNAHFVAHYDGASTWTDRSPLILNEAVHSVFGFGPDDTWICGDMSSTTAHVLQWTGSSWVDRTDSTLDSYGESWNHLGGLSSSDLWMTSAWMPDLAHWDGNAWEIVTPDVGPTLFIGGILQIGELHKSKLWAFGEHSSKTSNIIQSNQMPLSDWDNRNLVPGGNPACTVMGLLGFADPVYRYLPEPFNKNWQMPGSYTNTHNGIVEARFWDASAEEWRYQVGDLQEYMDDYESDWGDNDSFLSAYWSGTEWRFTGGQLEAGITEDFEDPEVNGWQQLL